VYPWFLQPLPVGYPAPSIVGFLTTNAILIIALMILGLPIPLLRVFLGPSFFTRRTAWKWFTLCLGMAFVGLVMLHQWSTFNELPISFAWSTVYISGMSTLRLIMLPLYKKSPNIGDHSS
jgi:hypothetical protein